MAMVFVGLFLFSGLAEAIMIDKILWESNRAGNYDIWMMDPDGSNKTQITSDSSNEKYPDVSPDGTQIVYFSDISGTNEIWVMDIFGQNQMQLTTTGGTNPTWSPDGSSIYYNESDGSGIRSMNADGTNNQLLTSSGRHVALSTDGSQMAYLVGSTTVYLANSDGSNIVNLSQQIGTSAQTGFPGAWNSDGELLLHLSGNIFKMTADGTGYTNILNDGNYNSGSDWSTDESQIVYNSKAYGNWISF